MLRDWMKRGVRWLLSAVIAIVLVVGIRSAAFSADGEMAKQMADM